jgi:hypothetical protein
MRLGLVMVLAVFGVVISRGFGQGSTVTGTYYQVHNVTDTSIFGSSGEFSCTQDDTQKGGLAVSQVLDVDLSPDGATPDWTISGTITYTYTSPTQANVDVNVTCDNRTAPGTLIFQVHVLRAEHVSTTFCQGRDPDGRDLWREERSVASGENADYARDWNNLILPSSMGFFVWFAAYGAADSAEDGTLIQVRPLTGGSPPDDPPIRVDHVVDENDGDYSEGNQSLREAVERACDEDDPVHIDVPAGTYLLDPSPLTFDGPNTNCITLEGEAGTGDSWATRIRPKASTNSSKFAVIGAVAHVRLVGLEMARFRGGRVGGGYALNGGAVLNHGRLELGSCRFGGNMSDTRGGAVYTDGHLLVTHCTFATNSCGYDGGALYINSSESYLVSDCLFLRNGELGTQDGGAVYVASGDGLIRNSLLGGNEAEVDGGTIYTRGDLIIVNSVVAGGSVNEHHASDGGGLYLAGVEQRTTLMHCTLAYNSPDAIFKEDRRDLLQIYHCAFDKSRSSFYGLGGCASLGYNLIPGGGGPAYTPGERDITNENARLTFPWGVPMPTSPALNAGDPVFTADPDMSQDVRGFPRIQQDRIDIGAFETRSLLTDWEDMVAWLAPPADGGPPGETGPLASYNDDGIANVIKAVGGQTIDSADRPSVLSCGSATQYDGPGGAFVVTLDERVIFLGCTLETSGDAGTTWSNRVAYHPQGAGNGYARIGGDGLRSTQVVSQGFQWTIPEVIEDEGVSDLWGRVKVAVNDAEAGAPRIVNSPTGMASVGSPFTYTFGTTNTALGFSASGLPPGLSIHPATGVISGTPAETGLFTVLLTATNENGAASGYFSLWVGPQSTNTNTTAITDGLIAYYPFDGDAEDAWSNALHATVHGPLLTFDVTGTPGKAYEFDRDSDYMDLGNSPLLRPTNGLSVHAWVYSPDWAGSWSDGEIVGNTQSGGWGLETFNSGDVRGIVRRDGGYGEVRASQAVLSPGWHQIVMTYDGRWTLLYVDGVGVATNDAGAVYPIQYSVDNSTLIGSEAGSGSSPAGDYLLGKLDEVRIYNRALNAGEISQLALPAAETGDLVANYPFSGNAEDSSGHAIHATVYGPVLSSNAAGHVNEAYCFDGDDDYIDLGRTLALKPSAALTVYVRAYHAEWTGASAREHLISNTESGGWSISLFDSDDVYGILRRNGTYGSVRSPMSELSPGWHSFAMTYDGRYLRLYVDGTEKASDDAGAQHPIQYRDYENHTILGAEIGGSASPTGHYFDGCLDEVRVFNRALLPAEVAALDTP